MLEFDLKGEVGWEIDEWSVRNILSKASGQDIKINFASPGGSVFEGITVFNMFKAYSGNVDFHLVGLSASMGSYIPLAGRRITAEPNVVFMIHNAGYSYVSGDHNRLRKKADISEGLSDIMALEYSKKTGITKEDMKALMDAETYYFGQGIAEIGFVDEITGDSDTDMKMSALALAKESVTACLEKVNKEKPDDWEKAAAFMPNIQAKKDNDTKIVIETKTAPSGKKKEGAFMDKIKLKAEHPYLYEAVISEGEEIGAKSAIEKERDRVAAFIVAGKFSGDMETALTAIKEGSEMTMELQQTFNMKAVNNRDIQAKQADDDDADPEKPTATADGADDVSKDVKDVIARVKGKTGFQEAK